MTDREVLKQIERSAGQRVGYKHLVRVFGLGGGRERRLLLEQLARLTVAGKLVKVDRETWSMARAAHGQDQMVAGRLDLHRDGFGFVRPLERGTGIDIFIPAHEIGSAMQGDQVLVELFSQRPGFSSGRSVASRAGSGAEDERRSGRIVRVLTRRNPTIVGKFHYARQERGGWSRGEREFMPYPAGHLVYSMDGRMRQPVVIPLDEPLPEPEIETAHRVLGEKANKRYESLENLVVNVEITEWPTATRPARGRVIEVLGDEEDFGVDVEMTIRKHHLPHVFPENVLAEARRVAHLDAAVVASRRDFRSLPIVTIDGETARDFDDAVLVREQADGSWELQVHIADVAQYVEPGSALDLEARLRGNSVYFPDRAIPMLPHELSTDICSLRPNEDRLVLSCLMQLDCMGQITGFEVTEGVICSARRMTYQQVQAILDGDAALRAEYAEFVPEFEQMLRLAQLLNEKRERRGSIDFDLPEPVIAFDEFGAMQSVTRAERQWSNRLIEEFMLSANECVASWIEQKAIPSLYRIHELPEARRVVEFEEVAASFGYSLGVGSLPVRRFVPRTERREQRRDSRKPAPRGHEVAQEIVVTSQMYQKLTARLAGKPEERIVAYLMLRSLKQARYSEHNEGHFALATPSYTHFTSPIRRYSDLVIHRIAKALLHAGVEGCGHLAVVTPAEAKSGEAERTPVIAAPIEEGELAAIAQEVSETERRAAEAERELVEWKKIRFMRDRVGEDFDALILSATKYGLFVELESLFIEGLVPIESLGALDGDRYSYRENTREIIGDRKGRKFGIGQRVRVLLERVDAVEKRLQFSILLDEEPEPKRRGGGKLKKEKEKSPKEAPLQKKSSQPAKSDSAKSGSAKSELAKPKSARLKSASERPQKAAPSEVEASQAEFGPLELEPTDQPKPKAKARAKQPAKKNRFNRDAVPAFAARVARPTPRPKGKKGKKKTSPSLEQEGGMGARGSYAPARAAAGGSRRGPREESQDRYGRESRSERGWSGSGSRATSSRATSSRSGSSRPSGSRYDGGRPESSRSESGRAEGSRPRSNWSENSRPENSRSGSGRTGRGRTEGSRSGSGWSEGARPSSGRSESSRPGSSRPGSDRYGSSRSESRGPGSRPRTERSWPSSSRSENSRSESGRPSSNRPSSGRPSSGRPSSSWSENGRTERSRPSSSGRPSSERPSSGRSASGRPGSSRAGSSRAGSSRPSSSRAGSSSRSGSGRRGDNR